jgi:hypothetical protein
VEKRETYCAIVRDITLRTYQPNLEGPNEYFAAMQRNKHSIDVLKQEKLTYDALIIHSQDAFRHSGIPMKEMRTIDEAWRKDQVTTHYIGKLDGLHALTSIPRVSRNSKMNKSITNTSTGTRKH